MAIYAVSCNEVEALSGVAVKLLVVLK